MEFALKRQPEGDGLLGEDGVAWNLVFVVVDAVLGALGALHGFAVNAFLGSTGDASGEAAGAFYGFVRRTCRGLGGIHSCCHNSPHWIREMALAWAGLCVGGSGVPEGMSQGLPADDERMSVSSQVGCYNQKFAWSLQHVAGSGRRARGRRNA